MKGEHLLTPGRYWRLWKVADKPLACAAEAKPRDAPRHPNSRETNWTDMRHHGSTPRLNTTLSVEHSMPCRRILRQKLLKPSRWESDSADQIVKNLGKLNKPKNKRSRKLLREKKCSRRKKSCYGLQERKKERRALSRRMEIRKRPPIQ